MYFIGSDTHPIPLPTWAVVQELSEHLLELVTALKRSEMAEHPAFTEFIKMLANSWLDSL